MAEDHSRSKGNSADCAGQYVFFKNAGIKVSGHPTIVVSHRNQDFRKQCNILSPDATLPIGRPTGSADGRGAQCAGPVSAARHQLGAHLRARDALQGFKVSSSEAALMRTNQYRACTSHDPQAQHDDYARIHYSPPYQRNTYITHNPTTAGTPDRIKSDNTCFKA